MYIENKEDTQTNTRFGECANQTHMHTIIIKRKDESKEDEKWMKLIMAYDCHGPDGSFLPINEIMKSFRHEPTLKQSIQTRINFNRNLSLCMYVVHTALMMKRWSTNKIYTVWSTLRPTSIEFCTYSKNKNQAGTRANTIRHRIIKSSCALCFRIHI